MAAAKKSKIDTTAAQAAVDALKGTCPTYTDVFEAARLALPAGSNLSEQQDYDRAARRIVDAWDKVRRGGSLRGDLPRCPRIW